VWRADTDFLCPRKNLVGKLNGQRPGLVSGKNSGEMSGTRNGDLSEKKRSHRGGSCPFREYREVGFLYGVQVVKT